MLHRSLWGFERPVAVAVKPQEWKAILRRCNFHAKQLVLRLHVCWKTLTTLLKYSLHGTEYYSHSSRSPSLPSLVDRLE